MAYVVAEPCIGTKDTACVDACPVDCIHPKKDDARFETAKLIHIDPVECIDCSACLPVCPVSAIFPAANLPAKWQNYESINKEYFKREETDSPKTVEKPLAPEHKKVPASVKVPRWVLTSAIMFVVLTMAALLLVLLRRIRHTRQNAASIKLDGSQE